MRLEAKKKFLAESVSTVKTLTAALGTSGESANTIYLVATPKGLKVKTVSGNQVVESTAAEVNVEEPGVVGVDMTVLASALNASGDLFKVVLDDKNLNYVCGRAKGRIQVKEVGRKFEEFAVKPTITIPNMQALLRALAIKGGDRTLHFDLKKKAVRGEATDSSRGVIASVSLSPDEDLPEAYDKYAKSIGICLPAAVLDAIEKKLVGNPLVGFNDQFFSLLAPGVRLCVPQSSDPPLAIQQQMTEWIGPMTQHRTVTVEVGALSDALNDALTLASSDSLTLVLDAQGGKFIGQNDSGEVEVTFEVAGEGPALSAVLMPSHLKECIRFYSKTESLEIKIYDQALVLSVSAPASGLEEQITLIPPLEPVTVDEAKGKSKKPKAKPQEDDEEAPPESAKKTPKRSLEEKPAAQPEAEAEDDEEAPPPAKKPAKKPEPKDEEDEPPAKKPAKKPEPKDEEDEESPDDEEESFDEEE